MLGIDGQSQGRDEGTEQLALSGPGRAGDQRVRTVGNEVDRHRAIGRLAQRGNQAFPRRSRPPPRRDGLDIDGIASHELEQPGGGRQRRRRDCFLGIA